MVQSAQKQKPGFRRYIYMDIEGHRNSVGGFDMDMMRLMTEYFAWLIAYVTEIHYPLLACKNAKPQRDDVPSSFSESDLLLNDFRSTFLEVAPTSDAQIEVKNTVSDPAIIAMYNNAVSLSSGWCECEKPEFLFYADDDACVCGMRKHHVHCKCGKVSQVG